MTAIGLLSDVHASAAPVREALAIFARAGVQQVFCAGDIAGYHAELAETVALLSAHGVRAVRGNHDLRYLAAHDGPGADPVTTYLQGLPAVIDTVVAGRHVRMVHAQPPDDCTGGGIRLLATDGSVRPERAAHWERLLADCACDVLVVGHTHQVFAVQLGGTLVVNPGSSAFNHACAILRLPHCAVELIPLSGRPVVPYWSWHEYMQGRAD
ncbi:MAG: metallophosphoesterase family protein [Pseudomonadota bacterium]